MRRVWAAIGERAARTFCQSLAAVLVASGTGVLDADWRAALSTAGMAGVLALLTGVAAGPVGPVGPSFGPERIGGDR